jgi:Histidine kinase-, DNA gyrase B-, and HSP90-like ATPase
MSTAITTQSPARKPLFHTANFLRAIRDVGYRSASHALAELVDNAIQAKATTVTVSVKSSNRANPIEVFIEDDGEGMSPETLALSVGFGGSTRFDDRTSLGRFGMGLPCAALSCSRSFEVASWQNFQSHSVFLDVDERRSDFRQSITTQRSPRKATTKSGTRIALTECDRIGYRRAGAFAKKIAGDLGRIFRRYIADGLSILVNGERVEAIDHLQLTGGIARQFGSELEYDVPTTAGTGRISIRFSELWTPELLTADSQRKRDLGIINAKQVSILRAGREICNGWYFMGSKRRENYDDWWRCEIDFHPSLDEAFGVNFAKQSISPSEELVRMLSTDIEPLARVLNSRVRKSFDAARQVDPLRKAEDIARRTYGSLRTFPRRLLDRDNPYSLEFKDLEITTPFTVEVSRRTLRVVVNSGHPLGRDLLTPLVVSPLEADRDNATRVLLAVIAVAHTEYQMAPLQPEIRSAWGDTYGAFLSRFS